MKAMVWAVLVLGMAVSIAMGEEMVDNPQYKQWAAFKPGAMTKLQMTSTSNVNDKEIATKMTLTMTLKELTPEKAVIEVATEMVVNGQNMAMPARSQDIPAKVAQSAAGLPAAPPGVKVTKKGEGDEEIAVGGKNYKAHWVEYQMSSDQLEATSKVWTTTEVPGGLLKSVSESTKPIKSKSTMELVEFKTGG
jgi:hypothetical protein